MHHYKGSRIRTYEPIGIDLQSTAFDRLAIPLDSKINQQEDSNLRSCIQSAPPYHLAMLTQLQVRLFQKTLKLNFKNHLEFDWT